MSGPVIRNALISGASRSASETISQMTPGQSWAKLTSVCDGYAGLLVCEWYIDPSSRPESRCPCGS